MRRRTGRRLTFAGLASGLLVMLLCGPALSQAPPPTLGGWLPISADIPVSSSGHGAPRVIFEDGFENGTSKWQISGDQPVWAATTYHAASGSHSAYCAGSTVPAPGPYANDMNTWLKAGPFDLTGLVSGTLSFKAWYVIQPEKDWMRCGVSIDGDVFYRWATYSGTSDGWVDVVFDLAKPPAGLDNLCGKPKVWILFTFVSDNTTEFEGAYVDEVSIKGVDANPSPVDLGLTAAEEVVPYDGSVGLTGVLVDEASQALLPNREVGLCSSDDPVVDSDWNLLGTATSATGEYAMSASGIQRLTYLALVFTGDSQYESGWSNVVKVMARAKVTPPVVPSTVRAGKLITSWGSLKPQHTADQNKTSHIKIYVERSGGGKWRKVASFYANTYRNKPGETQYAMKLRFVAGKWRVRAVHEDGDHARSASSWRTFTVR